MTVVFITVGGFILYFLVAALAAYIASCMDVADVDVGAIALFWPIVIIMLPIIKLFKWAMDKGRECRCR